MFVTLGRDELGLNFSIFDGLVGLGHSVDGLSWVGLLKLDLRTDNTQMEREAVSGSCSVVKYIRAAVMKFKDFKVQKTSNKFKK